MHQQNANSPTLVIAETPIRHDTAGRYCLNDLHQASGGEKRHQPSNFLRSDQAAELIAELSKPEGCSSDLRSAPVVTISGGVAQGTYAVKELVYAYAMWISARFVRVATVNSGLTHASVKCWLFRPATAGAAPALMH